jgi:hypothetical protein
MLFSHPLFKIPSGSPIAPLPAAARSRASYTCIYTRARAYTRGLPGLLGLALSLGAAPAEAKGIHVRFLANPAADSIVRYQILRAEAPGLASQPIGELPALPMADTLGFPDSSAAKGKPYAYSIKAINAEGGISDPSTATVIGFPALSLPDTLRPDKASGLTRFVVPAASDPLRGSERLTLTLLDSTRFTLAFDSATHTATFRTRSGLVDSGWARITAQYYGKFSDQDSVLLIAGMQPPVSMGSATWDGKSRTTGARMDGGALLPGPARLWQGRDAAGRLSPAQPGL